MLADSGSLFVQIGDENIHRLGVLLDEVFGPNNRVATITWRPTGMPSARLLGESASYLLWYAKDKTQIKYNAVYEERDRQANMDEFTYRGCHRASRRGRTGPCPDQSRARRCRVTARGGTAISEGCR